MKRPNVLWYVTDQQRFDTIAALGNPYVRTPTIDSLVNGGTAFTHAYCQSPICTPSRASFMTGMYPSRVHNCRNGNDDWPNHPPLISKLIADSGYDCGMVGKFHLLSSGRRTEPRLDDGYRFWRFSHAPRDDWPTGHDYADWVRTRGGDLDALRAHEDRVPPEFHQTTWATDMGIEFVDDTRDDDQPWFLTVNVYDPHPPFIPPREYADRYDPANVPGPHFEERDLETQAKLAAVDFQTEAKHPDTFDGKRVQALYYAMIEQVDDQLARLLAHLDATGQRENTIVVFTSDHGETLGDHGLLYKGCRFYEGLVRVPLIFSGPGIVGGREANELVELTDMSATLLEICGVQPPDRMQGRSLVPLMLPDHDLDLDEWWASCPIDPRRAYSAREFVRSEYFDALDPHFCVNDGDHTFATMYRDARWKLVVYHGHDLGELYDLRNDPWEHDNRWDVPSARATRDELIRRSFDASMLSGIDVGSTRIAPM